MGWCSNRGGNARNRAAAMSRNSFSPTGRNRSTTPSLAGVRNEAIQASKGGLHPAAEIRGVAGREGRERLPGGHLDAKSSHDVREDLVRLVPGDGSHVEGGSRQLSHGQ